MMNKSLSRELIGLAVAALIIAGVFFSISRKFTEYLVDDYYANVATEDMINVEMAKKLQNYIDSKEIGIKDTKKIKSWMKHKKIADLQIYVNDKLYYDSVYPGKKEWNHNPEEGYYDWLEPQPISFTDQDAKVTIYPDMDYIAYDITTFVSFVLSFIIYTLILMAGIRHKIRYVNHLKYEIQNLEGGDFDEEIIVHGSDELASLAKGLNSMRLAFVEERNAREALEKTNVDIITTLSHELRTPLTGIMLWIEILKKDSFENEGERQEVLDGIAENGKRLHELADKLLEFLLVP